MVVAQRLIAALLLVVGCVCAHAVGSVPATVESVAPDAFWQAGEVHCGGALKVPASGYIYPSATAAADSFSQEALNWGARNQNSSWCNLTTYPNITGVRTSFSMVGANAGQVRGNGFENSTQIFTNLILVAVAKGGTSCPSGWTLEAGLCKRTTCPANSTLSGASCTCGLGYKPNGAATACEPQGTCEPGSQQGGSGKYTMPGTGSTVCYNGCLAIPQWSFGEGASRWAQGPMTLIGPQCQGTESGSPGTDPDPNQPCSAGTCPGTVNGVPVCVPCKGTHTDVGTGTNTAAPTPENPNPAPTPGPTTVTQTTRDPATGGTTTTTTTTNPDGSVTETTTTEAPTEQEAFCKANPSSPLCKVSSWGGSCSSTSCDGDAVQCAIAREQHKRNCEFFPQDTTMSSVGVAAATGEAEPTGHPANTPQNINVASQINMTNPFGGSCPGDVSFTVLGVSQSVPLSQACTFLQVMGAFAVAFSLLVAARLVIEGV